MIFEDLVDGTSIFLDANTLLYHFTAHRKYGAACTRLLEEMRPLAWQLISGAI